MNRSWLAAGLLILSCPLAAVSPAYALNLVENGKPLATIVLPEQTEYEAYLKTATPAQQTLAKKVGDEEVLAAQELQEIIEKISGAKLPVQRGTATTNGTVILLGNQLARYNGLASQLDKLDKDGLLCSVKGNSLTLSGRRARGTLYAVYQFLESLGCRWTMPGPFGEIYPSLKTISTNIETRQNPSHAQRYWWCTFGNTPDYARWTLRMKGNFVHAIGDQYVDQQHALARPLAWGAKQEKYRVKTVDAQGKETYNLPDEYFALVDGKPSTTNPNFSNPKAWDLYADYYIDYFKKNPDTHYVSISAEDGLVIDERPESQKLENGDYDWMMGAKSATDKLWFFHNKVIEKVTKVFPDRKFGVLVYSNNLMPPRKYKVHPNMALIYAPLGVCPLHHIRDKKCKTNRTYVKWFEEWMRQAKAVGAESYYYDYEPTGYSWNMAMICPRWGIIGRNYPYFKQQGLTGHTTQGHDDWASCGLDNYLMQRLYWNADLDYRDVIKEYAEARFGAAAPAMIEYYNLLEKRMNEIPDLYQNEVWANHLILTPQVRKEARAVLERAVKQADTPRAVAQIATMVELQRSTDAMCDALEYADATGDFGKAAQMMEPVFAIRDRLNAIYPNFMNPRRVDKDEKTLYLTGGIYNQYREFDAKIEAATAHVILPRMWKGTMDNENVAVKRGYEKPEVSVAALDTLDSTIMPDVKYGTEREATAFFYRTEVDIPSSFNGKKSSLFFTSIIANELQVWINGQPVEFEQEGKKSTTWQGPAYFWTTYDHRREFDVTPHIKPGQKNTIAFRVFKKHDIGGTYRRIVLLASEP